jgi:hypothetical protein
MNAGTFRGIDKIRACGDFNFFPVYRKFNQFLHPTLLYIPMLFFADQFFFPLLYDFYRP